MVIGTTDEERLHRTACKEVGIEGQPQGVVGGHQMGHGLAQGEKDASGSKHAQQHLARPCQTDEDAVPHHGLQSNYRYGHRPGEIRSGEGDDVGAVGEQAQDEPPATQIE